jgi:hypothetical protein
VWWLFAVDDGYCEEGEIGVRPGELAAALSRLLRVAQNSEDLMLLGDPLAEGPGSAAAHRPLRHRSAGLS